MVFFFVGAPGVQLEGRLVQVMSPWQQISTLADVCSPEDESLYSLPLNANDKDKRPGGDCPGTSSWICLKSSTPVPA